MKVKPVERTMGAREKKSELDRARNFTRRGTRRKEGLLGRKGQLVGVWEGGPRRKQRKCENWKQCVLCTQVVSNT